MMPAWHQLVPMSGHVEESETARKLQLYATSIYQVHSFVCQLDYSDIQNFYSEIVNFRLFLATKSQFSGPACFYDVITT